MLLFPLLAFSQNAPRAEYTAFFDSIAGMGDRLVYNGHQFEDMYRSGRTDFRFYESPNYLKGDVYYGGQDYYNLDLKYDLVGDQVIVKSTGELNFLEIQLIKQKVERFRIRDRNFVYYNANEVVEAGFYEEAYKDEDNVLLVKYIKSPRERFRNNYVSYTFKEEQVYFIKSGETTKKINRVGDIRRLFKDRSELLKSYPSYKSAVDRDFRLYLINVLQYLKRNQ